MVITGILSLASAFLLHRRHREQHFLRNKHTVNVNVVGIAYPLTAALYCTSKTRVYQIKDLGY
jgi:hypothetical protein